MSFPWVFLFESVCCWSPPEISTNPEKCSGPGVLELSGSELLLPSYLLPFPHPKHVHTCPHTIRLIRWGALVESGLLALPHTPSEAQHEFCVLQGPGRGGAAHIADEDVHGEQENSVTDGVPHPPTPPGGVWSPSLNTEPTCTELTLWTVTQSWCWISREQEETLFV